MTRLRLSSVLGLGGMGMLLGGVACFQFYALPAYGELDHVVALGAGLGAWRYWCHAWVVKPDTNSAP